MADSTLVKAPKLILGTDHRVIDADTKVAAHGIAVFGAKLPAPAAAEDPIAAVKRWRASRQSKTVE